ncbi:putative PurR-regulated permease PerM [Conyzicola lurida]|uniref:Putative PurR-regulated permease PerM n=1 Tax=Conyzicola lurida TaxID=1172621 RepID=A0A841AMB8_9MICO|nr:hypothetical protein [Conyzicola lurida]MBB5842856.1 putative PurR-regulated permease PerM [Conyzicola lurida]
MPRSRFAPHRQRAVWFALGTGITAVMFIAFTVLIPLLTVIGTASGAAWFVRVPFDRITVAVFAGYLLSAGLLALILRTRRGPAAWILAVAAAVAALIVSLYPVVAAAVAGAEQADEIIPFISELIGSAVGFFGS